MFGVMVMSDAAPETRPAVATDSLTTGVIGHIRGLVDGNGAAGADLSVQRAERNDCRIGLELTVSVGGRWERHAEPGRFSPSGSLGFADSDAVMAAVNRDCSAAINDPDTAAAVARMLSSDPIARLTSLEDGYRIRSLPGAYHYCDHCPTCRGHGDVPCDHMFCQFGKVRCSACDGTGERICGRCSGSGQVQTQVAVWNNGSYVHQYGMTTCPDCGGRRRYGHCMAFGCMNGMVDCPRCGGLMRIGCDPCKRTGWFTYQYSTWLKGKVSRSWVLPRSLPESFTGPLKTMTISSLPGRHADVRATGTRTGPGWAAADYEATVPHVHAEMTCRTADITVDAIGKTGHIPAMPHFLDTLLFPVRDIIRQAAPRVALEAARTTRVTQAVLDAVGEAGRFDPGTVARRFDGAVAEWVVHGIHERLVAAYDGIGRSSVKRTWLLGAPLALAAALAVPFYDVPGRVLDRVAEAGLIGFWGQTSWNLVDGMVSALPFLVLWRLAGRQGRKAAQAVVGGHAVRRPRQGGWPWAVAAIIATAHLSMIGTRFYADEMVGIPALDEVKRTVAGLWDRYAPEALTSWLDTSLGAPVPLGDLRLEHRPVVKPPPALVDDTLLPPSSRPRLTPRPLPSNAETRGDANVFRFQAGLEQLGFYTGKPDGEMGPKTKSALDAFLSKVPDMPAMSRFEGKGLAFLIEGALRDDYRLTLGAVDRGPAGPLSNLARAHLKGDDLTRLNAAVKRAASEPGTVQSWRRQDGHMGGRVAVQVLPRQPGCLRLEVEVEVKGAVEATGPQTLCGLDAGVRRKDGGGIDLDLPEEDAPAEAGSTP